VPKHFKATKAFKKTKRGSIRWEWEGPLLVVQWSDREVVTVMSTGHLGHRTDSASRNIKKPVQGYHKLWLPRPEAISYYNTFIGGVDKSDQMIKYYEVLHKSLKYWKKIFLHMVDMAIFNAFIHHVYCSTEIKPRRPSPEEEGAVCAARLQD
jgi:hypothetical protein